METGTQKWSGVGRLAHLVAELGRQRTHRIDACIDTQQLMVDDAAGGEYLQLAGVEGTQATEFVSSGRWQGVPMNKRALTQLGQKVSPHVPGKFLCNLATGESDLACDLLTGLMNRAEKRLLIRQLDGEVRAVLSDKYRFIDNYDLVGQALETAAAVNARVVSCSLSDDHMRIKLIAPDLWSAFDTGKPGHQFFSPGQLGNAEWQESNGIAGEVAESQGFSHGGNIVWPVCTISNSETGAGGASVTFGVCDSACFNMMIIEKMQRCVHLGSKLETGYYSDETISVDSQAIMLKMRDSIKACFTPETLAKVIDDRTKAAAYHVAAPSTAVDNVVKAFDLPDGKRDALFSHFIKDYSPTLDGLSQAVARLAQDEPDADSQHGLEVVAGQIISQPALVRV